MCVAFGNEDQFSSTAKLDRWVETLRQNVHAGSGEGDVDERVEGRVKVIRVEGADHFWAKGDAKRRLLEGVRNWIS